MAHVTTDRDTTASPERVIGALTDFSPKRLDLWPNLDPKYFELEPSGATTAEVTEGSSAFGGVWERTRYDWSHPGTVRIEVQDSNAFQPAELLGLRSDTEARWREPRAHGVRQAAPQLQGAGPQRPFQHRGNKVFGKSLDETLRRVEASPS